jgi:putative peptidoglycan lipid II flippase
VHGLVYGVIAGAALHLAVQLPGLARFGFRWSPVLGLRDPALARVLHLIGPRLVTIGAFQLMFVVQDNLASRLEAGAVTALTYGWHIMQFPETLLATALGTALLPTLSEQVSRGDLRAFAGSIERALRVLLALTLPAAALLAVVVQPLVAAAFDFGEAGNALVAIATRGFLVGLVAHSWLEVLARAFYARQQPRPPLAARLANLGIFLGLGILLFRPLGALGIALANSLAFTLETGLLYLLLARAEPAIRRAWSALPRTALASIVAAGLAYGAMTWLPMTLVLSTVVGIAAGGLAAVLILRREIAELRRL